MANGRIVASVIPGQKVPGSVNYRLTDTDVLWATRMAVYETTGKDSVISDKPQQALEVLWTMASLFAYRLKHVLKKDGNAKYPTYTALIQAYSQPINPIWRRTGWKCTGPYRGTNACSPSKLARRDRHATVSMAEMRAKYPNTVRVVQQWADGKARTTLNGQSFSLRNPIPGSVEFAAPGVSRSFVRRNPGSKVVLKHANWFISTPYSQRFPSNWVKMKNGVGATPILVATAVVGGVMAGTFLVGR